MSVIVINPVCWQVSSSDYNADLRLKVKPDGGANLFRHRICSQIYMALKIIPFRRPDTASQPRPQLTPVQRAEALSDWAQELDVAWIFKEADRRMGKRTR